MCQENHRYCMKCTTTYQLPIWLRVLSSAEVTKGPCRVSQHAYFVIFTKKCEEWSQCALLKNIIPAMRAVTCNISQSPNSLFTDIKDRGGKEVDEFWDGSSLNYNLRMGCSSRCDISQSPSGLKLQRKFSISKSSVNQTFTFQPT